MRKLGRPRGWELHPAEKLAKGPEGSRLTLPTSNVGHATCKYQAHSQDQPLEISID